MLATGLELGDAGAYATGRVGAAQRAIARAACAAGVRRSLRVVAAITSALVAGIVLAGMAGLLPWIRVAIWISPLVLFHSVVGLIFRERVNQMIESLRATSIETRVLREGLQLLEVQQFRSAKLMQIAARVRNGSTAVRKLE
jgi:fatty acid desaturase